LDSPADQDRYQLTLREGVLSLLHSDYPHAKPVSVDFEAPAMRRRLLGLTGKDLLLRALGTKKWSSDELLLDLTAGLGTDAFMVAHSGHEVIAIEREAAIAQLLEDGLRRANQRMNKSTTRIRLLHQDALEYLRKDHAGDAHVRAIYLDPMFTPRRKSALGSYKLRLLLAVSGHDEDAHILLERALEKMLSLPRCERVVVKRRLHAPALLIKPSPSHQITGRTVRFDVYMNA
jgi:16S rRNA (guanine1516-N2)-methyltransferase